MVLKKFCTAKKLEKEKKELVPQFYSDMVCASYRCCTQDCSHFNEELFTKQINRKTYGAYTCLCQSYDCVLHFLSKPSLSFL